MNFYQNVLCTVTEILFSTILFQKALLDFKGCDNLVLDKVAGARAVFIFKWVCSRYRMWVWTAWQHCIFLIQNLDEAIFLNILAFWQKPYPIVSLPTTHTKSAFCLCDKKYFDYSHIDGGKGLILLSLKCFCHCSNVFSVTETYLECFSFPLINCNP